jgi:Flp pilus assembly protein CpaB
MNRRVLILLLLVVVLGGGALVVLLTSAPPEAPPEPTSPIAVGGGGGGEPASTLPPVVYAKIVVAAQEIPRGLAIPENGIIVREWPLAAFPSYGTSEPADVVGKIARTFIPRESPILLTQVVDNLTQLPLGERGSDAAAVLPPGLVAIALPIDRLVNVAHAPKSGDYVDVAVSFLFVDVDEEFQSILPNRVSLTTISQEGTLEIQTAIEGRVEPSGDFTSPVIVGPTERQRPRLATQRIVQSALVVYVGLFPPDGDFLGRKPPTPTPIPVEDGEPTPTPLPGPTATPVVFDPTIITLAVEPQDALALLHARDAGLPMTFLLRSAQDIARTDTQAVTLEYLLTTYGVQQPVRLPYALEPRISSIRRLADENQIPLAGQ